MSHTFAILPWSGILLLRKGKPDIGPVVVLELGCHAGEWDRVSSWNTGTHWRKGTNLRQRYFRTSKFFEQ